jgi:hypothetical protein
MQYLEFFTLNESLSGTPVSRLARIILSTDYSSINLIREDVKYHLPNDAILMPDSVYDIVVSDPHVGEIRATVKMPPAISVINESPDTVWLSSPGSVAGLLSWTALDNSKFSYVFRLQSIEENPSVIGNNGGFFENRYNGPQLSPQLLLLKSDFKFYGKHKLSIFTIDREFDALFFYDASDLRGLLKNSPENIDGAAGFVTGVSGFEREIVIMN